MRIPALLAAVLFATGGFLTSLHGQEAPAKIAEHVAAMEPHALAVKVKGIFEKSCAECHDGTGPGRDEGGFDNVLDLAAMTEAEDYVVPGDPEISEVYLVTFDPEPDFRMPPPDSDQPQLTEEEIMMVAQWIKNGAGMPEAPATEVAAADPPPVAALTPTPEPTPEPTPQATPTAEATPEVSPAPEASATPEPTPEATEEKVAKAMKTIDPVRVFAKSHFLILHFPIALLMVAALTEFFGIFNSNLNLVSRWSMWIATLGGIPSAISGWLLAPIAVRDQADVLLHRWLGVSTAAACVVGLILMEMAIHQKKPGFRWFVRFFVWALALLVAITGHTGGDLVHGEGFLFK